MSTLHVQNVNLHVHVLYFIKFFSQINIREILFNNKSHDSRNLIYRETFAIYSIKNLYTCTYFGGIYKLGQESYLYGGKVPGWAGRKETN